MPIKLRLNLKIKVLFKFAVKLPVFFNKLNLGVTYDNVTCS